MSNKIKKLTPEQEKQQEDERYLQGRPTRIEVMNYVNALLEKKYIPEIMNKFQLGIMVIQSILISKGICTGEEIEEITKQFIEQQTKEISDKISQDVE